MHQESFVSGSASLRERLMAPDPMQRALALHELEVEVERRAGGPRGALAHEAARFAARGIPYYALHDPHFQDWVGKAVSYWEKLHCDEVGGAGPRRPAPRLG